MITRSIDELAIHKRPIHKLRSLAALGATALALALAAGVSHAAAEQLEKTDIKMMLGWTFQASQAMFIYGVEKGYFKAEGLNVTVDRGSGSGVAIQRVAGGTYDFGYADLGTLTKYDAE